jgi:gliding motility-associated-like protein
MVTIYPVPHAAFSTSPSLIMENTDIQFTDHSSSASSWTWAFGDTAHSTSNSPDPLFVYQDTGTYVVTLYVTNADGCKDSISRTVIVEGNFSCYVPNAFTPNGDGVNDIFLPVVLNAEPGTYILDIFDRWGNLIFETSDPVQGWDGRANNGLLPAQVDTYVWKIFCRDRTSHRYNYKGVVNIIR